MGKLSNISGKDATKAFQKAGWEVRGQVGSHLMLTKQGSGRIYRFPNIRNSPRAPCAG